VKVEFATQPYAENESLCAYLRKWLVCTDFDQFTAITAWATFGGIVRVEEELGAFRRRGGGSRAVVGVDEGGATEQGLRLAAELFDEPYVFFSGDGRTFHPKVYFLTGKDRAVAFVGSNNMTPGGFFFNFEAAVVIDLDLTPGHTDDARFVGQLETYVSGLLGDTEICRSLKTDLGAVLHDPKIVIRDERHRRPGRGPDAVEGTGSMDIDADAETEGSVFGRSHRAMIRSIPLPRPVPVGAVTAAAPAVPAAAPPATPPTAPPATPPTTPPAAPATTPPAAPATTPPAAPATARSIARRWFRKLDATAAQQPLQVGSNPTGNLRLAQAGHPGLDQKVYFRRFFFGALPWSSSRNPKGVLEECQVTFDVTVNGRSLGEHTLRISHADYRIAAQNNVPTVLHWGSLMPVLTGTSYVGRTVTLECRSDGTYALFIELNATGPLLIS
jgi:hypothetical protein